MKTRKSRFCFIGAFLQRWVTIVLLMVMAGNPGQLIHAKESAGVSAKSGNKLNYTKSYYISDILGSTRAVVDAGGEIRESYDYYPFGLQMPGRGQRQGISSTSERFNGKVRDAESGWDYFGARYYDPAAGRWLTVDPLAMSYPSDTPYAFTANNPVNRIDTDGRYWETILDIISLTNSVIDVANNPDETANWVSLGLDVVGLGLPLLGGLGTAYKASSKANKALKGRNKVIDAGKGTGKGGKAGDEILEGGMDDVGHVFRGDRRSPEEVFQFGMQPRGKSDDLFLHALDSRNPASAFVSSSKKPRIAREFAGQGNYVYILRPQKGVDVNKALGKKSPYPFEQEVAIPGGVPGSQVVGARKVGADGKFTGDFIPNPNAIDKIKD